MSLPKSLTVKREEKEQTLEERAECHLLFYDEGEIHVKTLGKNQESDGEVRQEGIQRGRWRVRQRRREGHQGRTQGAGCSSSTGKGKGERRP